MMDNARGIIQEALERIQLTVDGCRPPLQELTFSALLPIPHFTRHRRRVRRSHIDPDIRLPCVPKHAGKRQPGLTDGERPNKRRGFRKGDPHQ